MCKSESLFMCVFMRTCRLVTTRPSGGLVVLLLSLAVMWSVVSNCPPGFIYPELLVYINVVCHRLAQAFAFSPDTGPHSFWNPGPLGILPVLTPNVNYMCVGLLFGLNFSSVQTSQLIQQSDPSHCFTVQPCYLCKGTYFENQYTTQTGHQS